METIQGSVKHIVYRNEDNGYTVFYMDCKGEEVTCTGVMPSLDEGERLEAQGEYRDHPAYGRQFQVQGLCVLAPEDEYDMERYLGSGAIKGIGPRMAERIVKAFGKDTFRVFEEEPERLAEVKGISSRRAMELYAAFHEKQEQRQAVIFLGKYGISMAMCLRIYRQYRDRIYEIVRENPYKLAEDVHGIGFRTADEIARHAGIDQYSPFRICSGIIYTLQQGAQEGHTCLPLDRLTAQAAEALGVEPQQITEQYGMLKMEKRIVTKQVDGVTYVYAAIYYYLEMSAAAALCRLDQDYKTDPQEIDLRIAEIEKSEGIQLDESQKDAVRAAAAKGVLVVTGGPGTGKTTTINAIIRYFDAQGMVMELAAPTGRAAKRMTEATGRAARTIHRLLEVMPSGEEEDGAPSFFDRNEMNPIEADVVIIDEMSMVDISLMCSLLKAVAVGSRLILVGDVNQLPSVGPGNVLEDIIRSGCFHTVTLTKIFRQAMESDIIKNAHLINRGQQIRLDNKSRDFLCVRRGNVMDILGVVVALARDKLPAYVGAKPYEIQVLTPMRKGELGVERLNEVLQHYLNPASPKKNEKKIGSRIFREGDKVMQIRNDYQAEWEVTGRYGIAVESGQGIFNGDIGIVKEINFFAEQLTVEFDGARQVRYPFSKTEDLEHAFAVTIHKSQGSEYPAVILPLLTGPRMLMNRNLLYTAVTRAKKCVVIVGSQETVQTMIDNERQQKRYTTLDTFIRETAAVDVIRPEY